MYSTSLCSQNMTLVSRTIIFKIREEISVELINKIDVWKIGLHINSYVPVGAALFWFNQEITCEFSKREVDKSRGNTFPWGQISHHHTWLFWVSIALFLSSGQGEGL